MLYYGGQREIEMEEWATSGLYPERSWFMFSIVVIFLEIIVRWKWKKFPIKNE